ncbi:MAG: bifunctional (p)ppGpp synthetase/guanosine-3',5'-bis(diphosphate) 3'-pyrophosphohydrolase [Bdellovibrionaceae bacterium]|jgi:GTP diphosphokinase / guanosine-3',5'-bis(diphosphate) 3'-diphosphatase|nr:bifunctional (p)ppGpp synthetase/guanosine-3',5'-bis(diphosphate) 3'-pyrophosphohydrolase [Pseudobdellovibrionaceae bacterium]
MSEFSSSEEVIDEKSPESIEELLERLVGHYSPEEIEIIKQAYEFSEKAHEGQIRRSGEPYIAHPLSVAAILSDLKLDYTTVATGLLHDTVEDTDVTLEDISERFGESVANLVDGVTKITQMRFRNTHEKQGENIRKMIVAMGKDVRVVLVKIADRLHNMRTLTHMPFKKQSRIAVETLDIYAPLASRLGINSLKVELEDLSFRYAYPDMYYELAQKVAKKKKEREKYIEDVQRLLSKEIKSRSKTKFEISGRPKHLYSIYKKMNMRSIDYEQVYDVLAFRVCVDSVPECYEILGVVHAMWKPIPGRFKDFIAMPKANNYQSLHTTVIGPQAERIEIQIRTDEMHVIAERGIAAHWNYKERSRGESGSEEMDLGKYNWLRELINLHKQADTSDEFLETIKTDLFESEIYVFTPKGEVKEFPEGATPIDFAFSVHTDVGTSVVAARVNGKLVPLKYKLQNGDNVEVITSKNQTPSKDWLNFCVTGRAKSKIRAHVKQEQRIRALSLGKEIVEKTFRKHGANASKYLKGEAFESYIKDQGCAGLDELYIKIGYGKLMPIHVAEAVLPKQEEKVEEDFSENFISRAFKSAVKKKKKSSSLVQVDGMSDILVRFAKCCNPIPGDPIMGFITIGRGLTVHRSDCVKAYEFDPDRRIDVEWSEGMQAQEGRQIVLRVVSYDSPGLLRSMTEVFASMGVNIHSAQMKATKDKKAVGNFDVTVRDTEHLSQVTDALMKLKGIIGVTRITRT